MLILLFLWGTVIESGVIQNHKQNHIYKFFSRYKVL